jgi:hypothetical protein
MSTTLMPPTYYVVRPQGLPAYVYETVREAAGALHALAPTAAEVYVMTGRKRRSLSDHELRQMGRHVRARRLAANPSAAAARVPRKAPPVNATAAPQARPVAAASASAVAAPAMKLPPFLDTAAVEAGLAAGLRREQHRFESRALPA